MYINCGKKHDLYFGVTNRKHKLCKHRLTWHRSSGNFLGKSHGPWASPVNKTSPSSFPAVSRQLSSSETPTALRSPTNNNNHIPEVRLIN